MDIDPNESDTWQLEMLKRLQKSAVPEPIKVACTVTPAGKPEYLGEEYHGTITREDEKRILDGKNGRYIVRESFTKNRPHEYTLAFNYDGDIQHIRLIYNESSREFITDGKKNGFKTVLGVMTDILNLYTELQRRESQQFTTLKKNSATNKPHTFKTHSYKHPKWCDICGNFLWGFYNQGEKCEVCGINIHKTCKQNAPLPCAATNAERKDSIQKNNERSKSSRSDTSNYIVFPLPSAFNQCSYFRKCSQFLSAFNIRDLYIDLQSNMTRCFCDDCIQETNSNGPGLVPSDNLKQWTRFQFTATTDPLKRCIGDWEVVYFAVNPKFVKDLIKGIYDPPSYQKDDEEIVVAPSLAYTTKDMENDNWSYKFADTETGGSLLAQTVLEVYLKPDSFSVMATSNSNNSKQDDSDIIPEHWLAKSKKDLYPKSILVKIFK